MLIRVCSILLVGLFVSGASAQNPVVTPENICPKAVNEALPRLIKELKSTDAVIRDRAIVTLGSLGARAKPAAPALIEVAVNTRGHALALQALAKIDDESTRKALRPLLVGGRGRCKCGRGFDEVVVSAGVVIVPHLISLLPEKEIASNVESVLVQMGEPAVPFVARALGDKNDATRLALYRSLTRIGVKAKSAVPALQQRLVTETGVVKMRAAQALYTVAGTDVTAFEILHAAVRGDDKATRTEALMCLHQMNCKEKSLVPTALKVMLEDETQDWSYAMYILTHLRGDAAPAVIEALSKDGVKHRARLMTTLRHIGVEARAAVPHFIAILDGNDRALATLAADSLPDLGPEAKAAIPSLLAAVKIDDPKLRIAAAQALVRIDRDQATHTVAPMVDVLQKSKGDDWYRAFNHLTSLRAQAKAAVPALLELLKTQDLGLRVTIASALHQIDPTQIDAAMPTLMEALEQKKNAALRRNAVSLIGRFGPKAKAAVPMLTTMLRESFNGQGMNPYTIGVALKQVGGEAQILPVVIDGLNSKNADEREDARYLVEDVLGKGAIAPLDAAIANGQLAPSAQLTALMKELRKRPQ